MSTRWTKLKLLAALAFGAMGAGGSAWAQDVGVEHLKIDLDTKKSRKAPKDKKAKTKYDKGWKRTCDQLGKAMSLNKGPWGFGAFGSFACYRGGKKIDGQEKPSTWTLTMVDGEKNVTFAVTRGKDELAKITMPPSEYTMEFFQDDEITDLVTYGLLDQLPMGMIVTKAMLKGSPPTFTGRHWRAGKAKDFKYKVPDAPAELVLYRLTYDAPTKSWRSKVVGTAKRQKVTPPKVSGKKKSSSLSGGEVVYETTQAVSDALTQGSLWAQGIDGPGARKKEIETDIKEGQLQLDAAAQNGQLLDFLKGKIGNILTNLLDTAASGYVGIRYGLQVLPVEGELGKLLGKTQVFSLLAEVRGGPLKGLRYYYDKLPETKATLEGAAGEDVDTSIAFARHTLGFSIDFNPGMIVDRITVDPKLGMWTFSATLPVEQNAEGKVVKTETFELGRTFSTALEVGLELLSDWYTLRGWYAINTGFSLLKSGGRVTSNNLGIDAYFTAGPTFPLFGMPLKTAIMGFYAYENVSLTSGTKEDPEPGEDAISGISYSGGYAGGGVAISW